MQELVSILLIGVSLSMDTFSFSLSLGTLSNATKYLRIFPFWVAIFHFIMPIIGNMIGIKIMQVFNLASHIILGLILIVLAVNLAISYYKKEEANVNLNLLSTPLLALSLSIDSFTVGLAISDITANYIIASLIFAVTSFSFTVLGIIIGKYSSNLIGKYASLLGIFLLFILGIVHIF